MNFFKIILVSCILLSTGMANAGFVATDWKVSGDSKATLDESSGKEWLDLTETAYRSINQVSNLLDSDYLGWRLPTRVEVNNLIQNMFPLHTFNDGSSHAYNLPNNATYRYLLGSLQYGARGLYMNDEINERGGTPVLWASIDSNGWVYEDMDVSSSLDYRRGDYGVWLVNDGGVTLTSINDPSININNANAPVNNVSAPISVGILALGLFGFATARRKQLTN
jgi:hypothetical protein